MKRREALKLGLLATAGTLIGCSTDSTSTSPTNITPVSYDNQVIIIGAGISGLAAAQRLASKNIKVLILEGRDRIGGRIWTDKSLGFPFDMGAGWIHGPSADNPITKLAADAGAKTYLTNDGSFSLFDRAGKEVDGSVFATANASYNNLLAQMNSLASTITGNDIPFSQALNQVRNGALNEDFIQWMMSSYLEFDKGGPIENLSAKNWNTDDKFEGKDVLFPEGYEQIFKNFSSLTPNIKLSHTVTNIEYTKDGVSVTTDKGTFTGKHCLCTLPLGVLKKGDVKFSPELPDDKKSTINRMQMGGVNKVVLVFDRTFWNPTQQYYGYDNQVKGKFTYFLNLRTFTEVNALVTFGFGNYGYEIDKMTNEQISQEAMIPLRLIFGNDIPNPSKVLVTRWGNDKFSYGAYSFGNLNTTYEDFENFGKSVINRLHFAGEHTSAKYRATVHGAYLSGIREGEKISTL